MKNLLNLGKILNSREQKNVTGGFARPINWELCSAVCVTGVIKYVGSCDESSHACSSEGGLISCSCPRG